MKFFTKRILLTGIFGFCCLIFGAFIPALTDDLKITASITEQAAKVLNISFTKTETDSMLNNLNDQQKNYDLLRKLNLSNNISPALNFNPLPAGYIFPDQTNEFVLDKPIKINLPENIDDLAFYTIPQLAQLLRTGKITSVNLTKFFIERLKKYNPQLHCVITFTEDRALKQAAKADVDFRYGKIKSTLQGIPFGVKDLLATKDYPTTWGSAIYKQQEIDLDATVIKRLEAAGAVMVAKMSLGELAMDDEWFGGLTKNPWDLTRGSSGSSAGSASAVSAGLLPFAIGSETWGSIVSPANECGVSGLRPTFGRIPKNGAMALSWSMDKLGPMARTVEDCAIVFNEITGTDGLDLSAINAPFSFNTNRAKTLTGVKIGYIKSDFENKYPNKKNDSLTIRKLRDMGAELVPIELPKLPYDAMAIILTAECGAAFQELVLTNKDDLMVRQNRFAWPTTFRSAQFIPAVEYINANRARTLLINELAAKLKGLDLYIAPSFSDNLLATNLSGNPCVVLPNGKNDKGLPTSITFNGTLFGEGKLLQAAVAYQRATAFHLAHPNLKEVN